MVDDNLRYPYHFREKPFNLFSVKCSKSMPKQLKSGLLIWPVIFNIADGSFIFLKIISASPHNSDLKVFETQFNRFLVKKEQNQA